MKRQNRIKWKEKKNGKNSKSIWPISGRWWNGEKMRKQMWNHLLLVVSHVEQNANQMKRHVSAKNTPFAMRKVTQKKKKTRKFCAAVARHSASPFRAFVSCCHSMSGQTSVRHQTLSSFFSVFDLMTFRQGLTFLCAAKIRIATATCLMPSGKWMIRHFWREKTTATDHSHYHHTAG